MNPPRVCVFAGSGVGTDPAFAAAARELGAAIAGRDLGLVFGGEAAGLMGAVADGAAAAAGEVIGIIPGFLADVGTPTPPPRSASSTRSPSASS
jgi:predicted Rossmann-fold nucleotide-binding protein